MSKKNRVVASITIHVTENGSYKVGEVRGEQRHHRHDLTWTQTKQAIKEFQASTAPRQQASAAGDHHLCSITAIFEKSFPKFSPLRATATSSAHSCTGAPIVPPQAPVLDLEAYEKSPPYWNPDSPQRLHLIELTHAQARRLQLPMPTWTEIEALLNPFISPVYEKLADHVRCMYRLNEILFTK